MERKSLSKHHGFVGARSMKAKVKDSWEYNSEKEDLLSGLMSWPPRSYTCSFCKREFRSAQALGGHMNVHRRDRARLRDFSPPKDGQYPFLNLHLNPNPNPNPHHNPSPSPNQNPYNPSSSQSRSPSTKFPPFTPFVSPSLSSLSSPSYGSPSEIKKWVMDPFWGERINSSKTLFGVSECEVVKRGDIVRLDLEIGLVSDHSKEDLDLELRLGRS